jgi:hypothetical protein
MYGLKRLQKKSGFYESLVKSIPQGLRPSDFEAFSARLKPCPFKTEARFEFFRSL